MCLWSHLVAIPNVISSGKVGFCDLGSISGGFLLISFIDLNCDCSWAVVRPDLHAPIFSATKSLSGRLASAFTDFLCKYQCDTAVKSNTTHRKKTVHHYCDKLSYCLRL